MEKLPAAARMPGRPGHSLVLPIGQDLGNQLEAGQSVRLIRRGTTVHELDETEQLLWSLAHGSPAALDTQTPWELANVLEFARMTGAAMVAEASDSLHAKGLLVEVDPESEAVTEFATTHRLIPIMLGLGNSTEDPKMFSIGLMGRAMLEVDYPIYDLWQWSIMEPSLTATCAAAAEAARRMGADDYLDADELLRRLMWTMHALLCMHVAYLDVPFRLDSPSGRSGL